MALLTGNDGQLVVGSTTIAALRNFSVELSADTIETTVMGNDARTYLAGLSTWQGSADIYFDTTESTSSIFNLTGTAVGASPITGKFYVKQDTTDSAYTGTCLVTAYSVKSAHDGMVEATISLKGSGGLTYTTGSNVA